MKIHLARTAFHRRAAARAELGEVERLLAAVALAGLDANDLRNDLAGFLDHDGIAETHVLAEDLIGVVQTRVPDRRPREQNGRQHRDRG